jgi:hypothetical protein
MASEAIAPANVWIVRIVFALTSRFGMAVPRTAILKAADRPVKHRYPEITNGQRILRGKRNSRKMAADRSLFQTTGSIDDRRADRGVGRWEGANMAARLQRFVRAARHDALVRRHLVRRHLVRALAYRQMRIRVSIWTRRPG